MTGRRYDQVMYGRNLHKGLIKDAQGQAGLVKKKIHDLLDHVGDRINKGRKEWTLEQTNRMVELLRIISQMENDLQEIRMIVEHGRVENQEDDDLSDYKELVEMLRELINAQGEESGRIINYKRKKASNE